MPPDVPPASDMVKRYNVLFVSQVRGTYCFPACLESYLRDRGVQVSQKQIIDKNAEEFSKDKDIEGAMSVNHLEPVMKSWGLSHEILEEGALLEIIHPQETVFFTLFWPTEPGNRHWVRYEGRNFTTGDFLVMEPSGKNGYPTKLTPKQLSEGRYVAVKITQDTIGS